MKGSSELLPRCSYFNNSGSQRSSLIAFLSISYKERGSEKVCKLNARPQTTTRV